MCVMNERILLIDDHAMFRGGVRLLLKAAMPSAVVAEAGTLGEALAEGVEVPDVVLLDIKLPDQSGIAGLALLKRKWPAVPVLMVSSLDTPEAMRQAFACGAAGFISKSETPERFVESIGRAIRGETDAAESGAHDKVRRRLTPRQHEVLELLGQGLSNKLIARQLSLSENTVRRHVQDILEHLGVASRAEAVIAARRMGLLR